MAKTTSQIVKENRERQKVENQIAETIKEQATTEAQRKTSGSSVSSSSASKVTDPVALMQKKKEDAAEPKAASLPSQNQMRADEAKKRLQSFQSRYDAKVQARTEKQKQDQFYSDLVTGDPGQIVPIDAPDEEEQQLQKQVERAKKDADYWDSQVTAEKESETRSADMAEVESWDEADREELERYINNRKSAFVQSLNPALTGVPAQYEDSYLIEKYGRERLDEIASSYQRNKDQQDYEAAEQEGRDAADKGIISGVAANAASIGANLADTLLDPLERIANGAGGNDERYSTIDPYAGGKARAFSSGVRGESAENIQETVGGNAGKVASYIYQGGMSALDSGARALVGGTPVVGAGLAALGSFNQTLSEASSQGASPEQAVALATINAGIEALTEKIPLDKLFKIAEGGTKTFKEVAKNIFKQMATEVGEEELSLLGTTLAEAAILKEKSGYNQQIMKAAAEGVPYEQAVQDANRALLAEAANAAIVSAISGGFSAAGAEIGAAKYGNSETDQQAQEVPQQGGEGENGLPRQSADWLAMTEKDAGQVQEGVQPSEEQQAEPSRLEKTVRALLGQETLTPEERGARYKASKVNTAIVDMIERVKSGVYSVKEKIQMGTVPTSTATRIKELTGIDVTGFDVALEARQVYHILKDHGEKGKSDRSMANPEDIARMEYALQYPDDIRYGGKTNAYTAMQKGKSRPVDTVLYEAQLSDNSYYVVQAVPDTKKKTLYIVTAFMGKPGYKKAGSIATPEPVQAGSFTPVATGGTAPRTEVPQSTNTIYPGATPEAESTVTSREATQSIDINDPGATSKTAAVGTSNNSLPQNGAEVNGNRAVESDYYDEFEDWGRDTNREGVENPMADRKYSEVGKRSVKAYMYENPAVKPFYQEQAAWLLSELADTTKGERTYNEQLHYESGGEQGWSGTKRQTSESIAALLDQDGMTYDQIERGLNAILNDNGQENNAVSKRIEFVINDRLMNGYTDFFTGKQVPGNAEYLNLLRNQQSAQGTDTQTGATNQSAEGGQKIKGTGAAEQNFTGTAAYDDLLSDDNVQRPRRGDVRDIEVPKTDADGRDVSEFVGNSMNSRLTPESFTGTIKTLVQDGKVSHDVQSNEESLRQAAAEIAKDGTLYRSVQKVAEVAKSGKTSVTDVAKAELLYNHLVQQEDQASQEMAADVYVTLAQLATNSGRSTQMFSVFRRMTPDGQVMALEQEVTRNVEKLQKSGQVKKDYRPQINQELLQNYRNAAVENKKAKTPEAQTETMEQMKLWQDAIYAEEASKLPSTFKAKWDAWRYMSMLGNAKTQVRNLAGNAAFMPYKAVKDKMASLFELALPKDQRTKALVVDNALMKWAKADAKTQDVKDALQYSGKLGDDVSQSKLAEQMQVFDTKALDSVRKFVEKVPSAGDMLFKNNYYAKSLAGFLTARGYTASQIQNNQVDNAVLNEARSYAINEAMKATFNDSNAFSDAVASIGRKNTDNVWSKALNIAAEGILPFRRTPANIVVRFAEYSPAGLAKGMWNMAAHVKNGDMSASTAIDQITAGLTGSGMMMLGYMMAAGMNGIKLTGSGTDEDEERQGHQDYALEFSVDGQEYSYKIDWAAPANLPLFVGANIYEAMNNTGADTDVSKLTAIIRGMGTAFEPMLALSCMSSLNDLVEGVRYAGEGEALYTIAADVATSYFTQGIPSLVRQAYQATQENKQTTFANSADPTIRDLQKTAAGIPFVAANFQTDKVNAWGEKEEQGNWMQRTFNAFLNPGTAKAIDNSDLEQEITRLNEAQTESVTPPTASKTLSYTDKQGNVHKDVRLTEEQYQTLATTQGQTEKTILDSMIGSKDYKALTDEQKAKAIQQVYSYARETAEIAAIGDSHTGYGDSWMMELEKGKEAQYILRRVASGELSGAMSALDTAWDKGYDEQPRSDDLKWAYDTFKSLSLSARNEVKEWATGTTAKYIEAREKGISHEDFVNAAENVAKVTGTGSNGSVRDIDRREAIAKTTGLSAKEIDTVMKCYMEDYDPTDESPSYTEVKYDYIRQELGLSASQYAETYRAHLDNSKKADKIAAIMDLGYDKKTATALYNVYSSNTKGKTAYMNWYDSQ